MSAPSPLVPQPKASLSDRFRALTGREPTPAELERFEARRNRLLLGLPLSARRHAARVIARS
jgi:hypothetical protein